MLNRIVDPRTIPVLNALIDSPVLFASSLQAPFARRAAIVVEHLRQTLHQLERIPDDELAVVSRIEKRFELPEVPTVSSATLEQLLDEVFALPGEDAPRQVLGDALMANGEPPPLHPPTQWLQPKARQASGPASLALRASS